MKEEAFPKIKGSYAENGNGPRGNASTKSISTSSGNVNTNHAAARKAAQLATIERNNPFDSELGAHTWIRSAEDADTWRGVDAGRPTHIKRACGIASQTLLIYV